MVTREERRNGKNREKNRSRQKSLGWDDNRSSIPATCHERERGRVVGQRAGRLSILVAERIRAHCTPPARYLGRSISGKRAPQ